MRAKESMGFSMGYSGAIITLVLCKATLVLTVFKWVWSVALSYMGLTASNLPTFRPSSSSSSSSSSFSTQMIRDNLPVSTFGELRHRLPEDGTGSTCAVCLNNLRAKDKVWELRNCCHVFHKRCLDGWLDHDEHKTCPLCRAPLLSSEPPCPTPGEPSWAVERFLYLFADDLLST